MKPVKVNDVPKVTGYVFRYTTRSSNIYSNIVIKEAFIYKTEDNNPEIKRITTHTKLRTAMLTSKKINTTPNNTYFLFSEDEYLEHIVKDQI